MNQPRRILVVDDEAIIVDFLKSVLRAKSSEYLIETAERGAEALERAHRLRPHLVLLDINLPNGGGASVCRQIREDPSCRHTIVVAITSDPHPDRVRKLSEAGARECLTKPLVFNDFLAKVERYSLESLQSELAHPADESTP